MLFIFLLSKVCICILLRGVPRSAEFEITKHLICTAYFMYHRRIEPRGKKLEKAEIFSMENKHFH